MPTVNPSGKLNLDDEEGGFRPPRRVLRRTVFIATVIMAVNALLGALAMFLIGSGGR